MLKPRLVGLRLALLLVISTVLIGCQSQSTEPLASFFLLVDIGVVAPGEVPVEAADVQVFWQHERHLDSDLDPVAAVVQHSGEPGRFESPIQYGLRGGYHIEVRVEPHAESGLAPVTREFSRELHEGYPAKDTLSVVIELPPADSTN